MIESISTIKAKLAELEFSMQSDYIKRLRSDSRKGVQQVIRAWEKKQQQAQESLLKLQEMKQFESEYLKAGYSRIAGVDEVGRGPLAGPVVAAAVILPNDFR
ncbi:Ribonuclease HII [Listeria grayi]|uniref:Ribonuclease n=1 Tax=Listeria grayi TaxID=1641 RepID=A0A378MCK8_LISGR|nr:Ribonuclease HII [Listeria grayi]